MYLVKVLTSLEAEGCSCWPTKEDGTNGCCPYIPEDEENRTC